MSRLDFFEYQDSSKHCASKQGVSIKKLVCIISSIATTVLILVSLLWLTLHPVKPHFSLQQSELIHFNLTEPQLLNSSIGLALTVNNPNTKVSIYYDDLNAYAAYHGERITSDTPIPALYQDHEETDNLNALLIGTGVLVGPYFGNEVWHDQAAGELHFNLILQGKLKYRVGTWISDWHLFNVNCDATFTSGPTGWRCEDATFTSGPTGWRGEATRRGSQCSISV